MKTKLKVVEGEQTLNSMQVVRDAIFSYTTKITVYSFFFLFLKKQTLLLKMLNSSKWVDTGQRFQSLQK